MQGRNVLSRLAPILCTGIGVLLSFPSYGSTPTAAYDELESPAHQYWTRSPQDPFSKILGDLEGGRVALDSTDERSFVLGLLRALDISPSSQLLVFSTTSLQSRLISPRNPRALYFNDDVYVGYIPDGRIEVIGTDPELGAIFYIFDIPRSDKTGMPPIERSNRCMNCHAAPETGNIPGLVVKSVIPGPNRGSLAAFRDNEIGHQVPLPERFGGWYLTGVTGFTNHWANRTGLLSAGELSTHPVEPGISFDPARYPVGTSDFLAHLLHEHQAGFLNKIIEAAYRARTCLLRGNGTLDAAAEQELDEQARLLTRYILFAEETPLVARGAQLDSEFQKDFLSKRRIARNGNSLRDLDLESRLFRFRCSYMIYSPTVQALPGEMKQRLWKSLSDALDPEGGPEFAYLPVSERLEIRRILKDTIADLPADF